VELQHHHGEDDQSQYAGEYPYNGFDGAAGVSFDLILYQKSVGNIFLLRSVCTETVFYFPL
jgi:hypothetical protein